MEPDVLNKVMLAPLIYYSPLAGFFILGYFNSIITLIVVFLTIIFSFNIYVVERSIMAKLKSNRRGKYNKNGNVIN